MIIVLKNTVKKQKNLKKHGLISVCLINEYWEHFSVLAVKIRSVQVSILKKLLTSGGILMVLRCN